MEYIVFVLLGMVIAQFLFRRSPQPPMYVQVRPDPEQSSGDGCLPLVGLLLLGLFTLALLSLGGNM